MPLDTSALLALCVAAGIGLLVGAERERSKGGGALHEAAGIRTFTIVALCGAVSRLLGEPVFLVTLAVIGGLTALAYQHSREHDPGLTSEIALVLTCLLGGLAVRMPLLAAGVGVALAGLLAWREGLHRFVQRVLTERELHDAILFAAAALIALPLAPDRALGPFDAINPHTVVRLVVLVMAISALGYVAVRAFGSHRGLPIAGLASGFVSSTATIHAMGQRAREHPAEARGAVAGAVLSSVATIAQLAALLALVQPELLRSMALPLALAGVAALAYAASFVVRTVPAAADGEQRAPGRAFNLRSALLFAFIVTTVLLGSAALNDWLGAGGLVLATALGGLVDAHAPATSVASLVAADKLPLGAAMPPILAALSTNTLVKAAVALQAGGLGYAARIVPGLAAMLGALWLGAWLA